jgi:hypothetical protein
MRDLGAVLDHEEPLPRHGLEARATGRPFDGALIEGVDGGRI